MRLDAIGHLAPDVRFPRSMTPSDQRNEPRENRRRTPGDATRGEIEVLDESVAWSNDSVRVLTARVRYPSRKGESAPEGDQMRVAPAESKTDGVVVAPITADDRVLLVRQFRHPVRMWLRELPRGGRDAGESPEDAARRELREEVGCDVLSLHPLGRVAADSGQLASLPWLFAARVSDRRQREPEATEAIDRVIAHSFRELLALCERGQIVDGFTLATVMRLIPHFRGERFVYDTAAMPDTIDEE